MLPLCHRGPYIQFGFPLAIDYNKCKYITDISNHFSAMCRDKGVDKYFQVETSKYAILGPFDNNPFDEMHFSPLMPRDKPDGNVREIVDLSWPIGQSVNSCTTPGIFDNVQFQLKYSSIDLLVQKSVKLVLVPFFIKSTWSELFVI